MHVMIHFNFPIELKRHKMYIMNNIKIIIIKIQSFKVYFFFNQKKKVIAQEANKYFMVCSYLHTIKLCIECHSQFQKANCSTTAELKDSIYACLLSYTLKKNSRFDHKEKKKKNSWTINYFHERYALIYTIIYLSATIKITLHRNYSKIRCKKVVKFSKQ